jgi:hypothetical protein
VTRVTAATVAEAEFQAQVVELAGVLGWWHMHVRRSIGKGRKWVTATNVPWPDLTLWRPPRSTERTGSFLVRELKVDARSPWQPGQREVLDQLHACGVDAGVWYAADLDNGRIALELGARR